MTSSLLLYIIFVGLGCGVISHTVTFTSIFKPLRERLGAFHEKLDELLHCPFCFNMWVTIVVVLATPGEFLVNLQIFSWSSILWIFLLSIFSAQAVAGLLHFVLIRAYTPIAKQQARRKLKNNG